MNKLTCGIVRDLLPSYVDGLTCEETNEAVEVHVEDCQECSEILKMMQAPEEATVQVEEVDYLKKVRRSWIKRAIIIGLVLMVCGVSALAYRVFWVGYGIDASSLMYQVEREGKTIWIHGTTGEGNIGISRVVWEKKDDVVDIKVFAAPKTFWNEQDFHTSVTLSSMPLNQIRLNGTILWDHGKVIHPKVSALYEHRNPYVGDMSANGAIARILFGTFDTLGIVGKYGTYNNELQTSTEPYGWSLWIREEQEGSLKELEKSMRADSFVMLATIENLGYVEWEFEVDGEMHKLKFTEEDATEFLGMDIKSWVESVSKLQELCEILDII